MKALITGASSGIGMALATRLSEMGYDLIITARRTDKLEKLKASLKTDVTVISADLSKEQECFSLYSKVKNENIDIVINNAGFGDCGLFDETDINRDLQMINVNITAVCILTKLFYKDFLRRNSGYILNVASIAAFMCGGPYMAQYYATKAYVLNLTRALYKEAKIKKSNVHICALCPGPVDTEFNKVANVKFALSGTSADYVAGYAIKKMLAKKMTILPTVKIKLIAIASKLSPSELILHIASKIQKSKLSK